MSTELPLANAAKIEALAAKISDLERVAGVLIVRLCDLEAHVSLLRPLPADHGRKKAPLSNGGTMATTQLVEPLRGPRIES